MQRRENAIQTERNHDGETSALARMRAAFVKSPEPASPFLKRIPLKLGDGLVLLPTSHVLMIVAHAERLTVTTADRAQHSMLYRLKNLENLLDPAEFLRVSRGAIINLDAVVRIVTATDGTSTVQFANGQKVHMSRNQTGRLRRACLDILK